MASRYANALVIGSEMFKAILRDQGAFSWEQAYDVALQATAGLAAIHAAYRFTPAVPEVDIEQMLDEIQQVRLRVLENHHVQLDCKEPKVRIRLNGLPATDYPTRPEAAGGPEFVGDHPDRDAGAALVAGGPVGDRLAAAEAAMGEQIVELGGTLAHEMGEHLALRPARQIGTRGGRGQVELWRIAGFSCHARLVRLLAPSRIGR